MNWRGLRSKKDPVRTILGFYSAEHADAEKAYQTIRAAGRVSVRLFRENGTKSNFGPNEHYGALRLDGESLLVARAPPAKVQTVVR